MDGSGVLLHFAEELSNAMELTVFRELFAVHSRERSHAFDGLLDLCLNCGPNELQCRFGCVGKSVDRWGSGEIGMVRGKLEARQDILASRGDERGQKLYVTDIHSVTTTFRRCANVRRWLARYKVTVDPRFATAAGQCNLCVTVAQSAAADAGSP